MKTFTQFQVDAFTSTIFGGNPAAVVPLSEWLPDETMQAIAMENQLSETAFFCAEGDGFRLRWFTPITEVNLCGHATLATAHVLFTEMGHDSDMIIFDTLSDRLTVNRTASGYEMDFPSDPITPAPEFQPVLSDALGVEIEATYRGREDLVAVLSSEKSVRELTPNFGKIAALRQRGVIVTAASREIDFVSRCFFPRFGIDEDPVTGSAHTTLAPFWADHLGKKHLSAAQLSPRGGRLRCDVKPDRVVLTGEAVTFLRGQIQLPSA